MANSIRTIIEERKVGVIAKARAGRCEGSCSEHRGTVRAFKVAYEPSRQNWGYFAYCEAAQEEDRQRGMTLTEVSGQAEADNRTSSDKQ